MSDTIDITVKEADSKKSEPKVTVTNEICMHLKELYQSKSTQVPASTKADTVDNVVRI